MKSPIKSTVLADARRHRGWTQEDLAFEIGTSQSAISRWESGCMIGIREFAKWCRALGVDISEAIDMEAV